MMLPGVEYARRRRLHQGGGGVSTSRYNTHNKSCRTSHFSQALKQATPVLIESQQENNGDYKLNEVALEARERLEEKLRASVSKNKRLGHYRKMHLQQNYGNCYEEAYHGIPLEQISMMHNRDLYSGSITDATQPRDLARQNMMPFSAGLQNESIDLPRTGIYGRSISRGKSLLKLLSRTSEQDNCPICLECFQHNQLIMHLLCGHKFHSSCLSPWLDKNDHCPYCRAKVSTKTS